MDYFDEIMKQKQFFIDLYGVDLIGFGLAIYIGSESFRGIIEKIKGYYPDYFEKYLLGQIYGFHVILTTGKPYELSLRKINE